MKSSIIRGFFLSLRFVNPALSAPLKVFILAGQSKAASIRKAQEAAAVRPEFKGSVLFVETRDLVRKAEDSPNTGHGHHEFGNAEIYFLVGDAPGKGILKLQSN